MAGKQISFMSVLEQLAAADAATEAESAAAVRSLGRPTAIAAEADPTCSCCCGHAELATADAAAKGGCCDVDVDGGAGTELRTSAWCLVLPPISRSSHPFPPTLPPSSRHSHTSPIELRNSHEKLQSTPSVMRDVV